MSYPEDIQILLDSDDNAYGVARNRLDVALSELEIIYAENFPYTEVKVTTGTEYLWANSFLDKCLIALATDNLSTMNAQELSIWYDYVDFSDLKTTSATDDMLDGTAIGCTVPDIDGFSFAIYPDGTVSTVECVAADISYPREALLKSLDNVFENMLNCLPYNVDSSIIGELENVSPCTI